MNEFNVPPTQNESNRGARRGRAPAKGATSNPGTEPRTAPPPPPPPFSNPNPTTTARERAARPRDDAGRYTTHKENAMECSTKTRSGMTLLGGAGLGAVLMYLLDPEQGERRRAEAAEAARRAAETTGAALAAGYEVAKEKGATLGERLGEYGASGAEAASSWTSRLAERAHDTGHSLGKTSRSYARSARESLPSVGSPRSWFERDEPRRYVPSGSTTLTAVACLAAGFGLMYLMDPQQGRRRRHVATDKTMKWLREMGDLSRRTGRHLANKSRGYAHEAMSAAGSMTGGALGGEGEYGSGQSLAGRIRARIRSLRGGQNVNVDCDDCGRVTLAGDCTPDEVAIIVTEVQSVEGVDTIDNRLNTGSTTGTGPGLGQ